jgi:thioredoxin-related protein
MTFKKLCIAMVVLAWLAGGLRPPNALSETSAINWHSYKDGVSLMKDQHKKGFLHFVSNRCGYCRLMSTNTFSDAKVIDYLNKNFIPILVNITEQRDLANQYGIRGVPSSWFLSENSSAIGQRPGFIPPDIMLVLLKYIGTDSFKTMSFNDYAQKNPATAEPHP